jgi:hypothetical protein
MKRLLFAIITLCLFIVVQKSIAQERKNKYDAAVGEPVIVSANLEASKVNRIDDDRNFELRRTRVDFYGVPSTNSYPNFSLTDSIRYPTNSAGSIESTKYPFNTDIKIRSPAFDITGLMYEQKSNGYLIQIQCRKRLHNFESWLKCEGNDTWLSVTIANAKADTIGMEIIQMPEFVKEFLIFQSSASVQLTFKLKGKIRVAELLQDNSSNNIFVAIHTTVSFPILARIIPQLVKHLSLARREVW